MKIIKLVVTGGPCAGKTTALAHIKQRAQEHGYLVLTVAETATELISGGVAPWTCDTNARYQSFQIALQMAKEEVFLAAAATMSSSRICILLDRGLMDNRAYMTEEEFSACLRARGEKKEDYLARYDAVFHLVTTARGAEKHYTTQNNAARTETPAEARAVDDALLAAWGEHPRRYIIGNDGDFAEKMQRLRAHLDEFLCEVEK